MCPRAPLLLLLLLLMALLVVGCQTTTRKHPLPSESPTASPVVEHSDSGVSASDSSEERAPQQATFLTPLSQPPATGAELIERLVSRLAEAPCVDDALARQWQNTYAQSPPRLQAQIESVLPLMAVVLEEVELHHLPGEFVLLPIVESWYRPDSGSARSAYGLWQFTTATARDQGLRIVPGYDERLAPQSATRAAMRYLAYLQNRFGDWKLAAMAYNAGEYRIRRVLQTSGDSSAQASAQSRTPPGLAQTTYAHLAKLQALACLFAEPQRAGLTLPLDAPIAALAERVVPLHLTRIDDVAAHAASNATILRALNPAFAGGRIVRDARRHILLPMAAAARLDAWQAAQSRSQQIDATAAGSQPRIAGITQQEYRVRSGDTLGHIAQRFGLRMRDLLRWNRMAADALLRPGQRLRLAP